MDDPTSRLIVPAWVEVMMRSIPARTREKLSLYDIDQIKRGVSDLIADEIAKSVVTARQHYEQRIAKLEAENDELKERLETMLDVVREDRELIEENIALKAEVENWQKSANHNPYLEENIVLKAENERLHKAIAEAPHDYPCWVNTPSGSCDCWKSKALHD